MKIALLSNFTMEILTRFLPREHSYYIPPGFDSWIGDVLAPDSGLQRFMPEMIFLLLDGKSLLRKCLTREDGILELDSFHVVVEKLAKEHPQATIFASSIDVPHCSIRPVDAIRPERCWESHWYDRLQYTSEQNRNLLIFDLKELTEQLGRKQFYSPRLWYMGGMPYSRTGTRQLTDAMRRLIDAYRGQRKKCLVLDLDNTLWGGVLGEEGLRGIQLAETGEGAWYYDFQRRLLELKNTGILLTIASKNNESDVREVLRDHPNMLLRENDFALIKANWNPKSRSLQEIAEELNIGLDSLVFFDDNPLEREEIRRMLPMVSVVDFPEPECLEEAAISIFRNHFPTIYMTDEDAKKTLQYIQEAQRRRAVDAAESFEDFLESLDIRLEIHRARPEEIARIAQLTHKTNQFNLTTHRYTTGDIQEKVDSPDWRIYTVHSKDRFGENGLISVVILHFIRRHDEEDVVAKIDTFLMSCRVMGRRIETAVMETIKNDLRNENIRWLRAEYIPTPKNTPVAELYERLKFERIDGFDDDRKRYRLDLSVKTKKPRLFATIIETETFAPENANVENTDDAEERETFPFDEIAAQGGSVAMTSV